MTYQPGSYSKELEEEHREGRHDEEPFQFCSSCLRQQHEDLVRDEGFSSAREFYEWMSAHDPADEFHVGEEIEKAHADGNHREYPSTGCEICVSIYGRRNI